MRDRVVFHRRVVRNRTVSLRTTVLVTCAALGFGAGVAVSVASAHGRGDGFGRGVVPAAAGTVESAPSGTTFTITTRSGATETIDVSSSTT
jgi:hypothetical protein